MDRTLRVCEKLRARVTGELLVRFACASVLVVAAGSKAYRLFTDPAIGTLYGSRWLQLLLIQYEVLLATWLISGSMQKYCRWAALATFSAFGSYAFYLGISGAESCGCFGRILVSPWWMVALDSAAALLVWLWNPTLVATPLSRLAVSVTIPSAIGLALIAVVTRERAVMADGVTIVDSLVVLEPEKWEGKYFPLFEHISIGDRLRNGSWSILLYHDDCPKCQEVLANLSGEPRAGPPIAIIDVSSHGTTCKRVSGARLRGRLIGNVTWFVETPLEITVNDGRVVGVSSPRATVARWSQSPSG